MTNDKTVTMSRELIEVVEAYMSSQADAFPLINLSRGLRSDGLDQVSSELRNALAAPVVERQDVSALMKIAADLANRHPLRQLYLVCEHQGRINTDSLHEHLDKCGDLLAGIALGIRRAITSPPAPVALNARMAEILQSLRTNANPALFAPGQLAEVDACLDKVKGAESMIIPVSALVWFYCVYCR